jgi:hypothetical protein
MYVFVRPPLSRPDINDPLSSSERSVVTQHWTIEPNPHQSDWRKSSKDWVINTKTSEKQGRRTRNPLTDYMQQCNGWV